MLGGASERLDFIISANGQQAVRTFKKVGDAADRDLGRVDDRLDKIGAGLTRFGAGGLAFSAVALRGLKSLADSASDVTEAIGAVGEVFGDAAPEVEAFADTAADLGLSKRVALDAAKTFGVLGKAAGKSGTDLSDFSIDLTSLAADMASFNNTTIDDAIAAIGAGLRGEAEPLRRYGVLLDDATLKAAAMEQGIYSGNGALTQQQKVLAANAVIFEQTADQQGDFERTSGNLANQQRILAAEFENLKASIGAGVVPVFQQIMEAAGGVADAFNRLPGPAKETLGAIAAYGTVGLGAVSALSLISGQLISARTNLGPLTSRLTGATKATTGLGRAAVVGARGLTAIGAALVGLEILSKLNDATADMDGFTAAVDRSVSAVESAAYDKFAEQVQKAAGSTETWADKMLDFQTAGSEAAVSINGMRVEIDNLDSVLSQLSDSDPEALAAWVDAFQSGKVEIEGLDYGLGSAQRSLDSFNATLEPYAETVAAADDRQGSAADSLGELDTELDNISDAAEEAATAIEDYNDALGSVDAATGWADAQRDIAESLRKQAEAQQELNEAQESGDPEKIADALRGLADANRGVEDAQYDAAKATAELAAEVEAGEVAFSDAVAAIDQMEASGQITADAAQRMRDEITLASAAAEQFDQDLTAIEGRDTIATIRAEADKDEAEGDLDAAAKKRRIADLIAEAETAAANGDLDGAAAKFRRALITAQGSNLGGVESSLNNLARSRTAYITAQFRASMPAWLQRMPGFGPVMEPVAGGPAQLPAQLPAATNVTVNMPAGSDGADVTRALRRYQARNGTAA